MKHSASYLFAFVFLTGAPLVRAEAAPAPAPAFADELRGAGSGVAQARGSRQLDETPQGLAASEWQSIRAAYEAGRHAFAPLDGGGWQARNPGQGWVMEFDGRGFLAQPHDGGWTWGLELKSYGCGETQREIRGTPAVKTQGQRLSYQWDAMVQEWFVNDERGLEHGFTVAERPAGTGSLTFHLSARGALKPSVAEGASGVAFQDASGATVLNYSGLKVWDAEGRVLPSHFEAAGDNVVRLAVDERGARYPVTIDPIAQQAYLKASNPGADDQFGIAVAVSGDTVVIGAPAEDSSTPVVNSTPNEGAGNAGAAYVFVRNGAVWSQQAYLKASNLGTDDVFGYSVAVSGDTVVVGAPNENAGAIDSGAAYVFVRRGAVWSQQAYLKASNPGADDKFGFSVAVSGDTAVVSAPSEGSSTTGVNSTPNEGAIDSGAAYVFVRSGAVWSQQAYLKADNTGADDTFGYTVAVSGDTAVVGAFGEDSSSAGVNSTSNEGASSAGAVYVFVRSGSSWSQQAYLKASNPGAIDAFGYAVAASGNTVVVGAPGEDSSTTGLNSTPNEGASSAGAVYVFVRSGSSWSQQAYLKASNPGIEDLFGNSVGISGDTMVVAALYEDSSTTGVNSTPNESALEAGAAYVFVRSGAAWSQQAYLKASNTGGDDRFGTSVAVSGDTVVAGADHEDSSTPGVNGIPNEDANSAGAAYVFNGVGNRGALGSLKVLTGITAGVDLGTAIPIGGGPAQSALILGGGGWEASEAPEKAADQNADTVYGNLGGTGSGLVFTAAPFNQITFYTRGNPLPADPIQFTLWLRANPNPDPTNPPSFLAANTTIYASGTLSPPSNAAGVQTVSVPLVSASIYVLTFGDLRGPSKGKMQIAEIGMERTAPRWDVPALTKSLFYQVSGVGLPGFEYTFYRNDSLLPTGWIPVTDVTAPANGKIMINDAPAGPRRFYRIVEKGVSISP